MTLTLVNMAPTPSETSTFSESRTVPAGETCTDRPTFQNRLQRARIRLVHHLGALTAPERAATADV